MKSTRNKTIELTEEEKYSYLGLCKNADIRDSIIDVDDAVNSVFFGDSFSVLKLLPKRSVDLLIVDPPYNLNKDFNGLRFKKNDNELYADYTERYLRLCLPLLKPTASVYVCCDYYSGIAVGKVFSNLFNLRNRITWQREKGRGAMSNWKNTSEDIWFGTVSDSYTFNVDAVKERRRVIAPYKDAGGKAKDWTEDENNVKFRDTFPSNFWSDITVPYWSMSENTPHPTQKPEKLMAKLILASSNPDNVVLDPFCGSGTSCVVAKKLGRRYIGIEIDPEYCALAQKRLELAERDKAVQGFSDGVFWERNTLAEQKKAK